MPLVYGERERDFSLSEPGRVGGCDGEALESWDCEAKAIGGIRE